MALNARFLYATSNLLDECVCSNKEHVAFAKMNAQVLSKVELIKLLEIMIMVCLNKRRCAYTQTKPGFANSCISEVFDILL